MNFDILLYLVAAYRQSISSLFPCKQMESKIQLRLGVVDAIETDRYCDPAVLYDGARAS